MKNKKIPKKSFLLVLLLLPFIIGCGSLSLLANPGQDKTAEKELDAYAQWRNTELSKVEHCIGSTKEEIKEIFGEPKNVTVLASEKEIWKFTVYQHKKAVGEYRFFFKGNQVYKIDVI